jgi:putative phosphonate catabolism associated alcohol dehydrogenase
MLLILTRYKLEKKGMADDVVAAVFTAAGKPLQMQSFALPELQPGELLVRVTCCTVCGSDLHTYEGRRETPTPTILGHEILGEVAALPAGPSVCDLDERPLKLGDRITWSIAANCGDCFYCEHDLPAKCEQLFKYGHEAIDPTHPLSGGLAEFCHLAAGTAVVQVPKALSDVVACPANCATATVAAALRVGGGCAGEVVLIQGAGMLGLSATALAATRGAAEVLVCDVDPNRLQQASRFGATQAISVAEGTEALSAAIQDRTAGRGVDLAIELSGSPASIAAGLAELRIGGRYVLVGSVFPSPDIPVSAEWIVRRWLSIHGVHNYAPRDLATAIAFLAEAHAQYPLAELVSQSFPLEQAEAAFQYAIEKRPHRVAVLPAKDQ